MNKLVGFLLMLVAPVLIGAIQPQCAVAQQTKYWIQFSGKGDVALNPKSAGLAPRALERRVRTLGAASAVSIEDLPIYEPYLERLERMGIRIQATSRWMNAVSVYLDPTAISNVESLPFVARVFPVSGRRLAPEPMPVPLPPLNKSAAGGHHLDYGRSLDQLEMIGVPEVHDCWIDGTGAVIGMLDTGFRRKNHQATRTRRVMAERDFINNDGETENENGDPPGQDGHGTATFSSLSSYMPGMLIGPAYEAQYYLAKTEVNGSETRIEEDYWVQGIEWLEAQGVDIISSSLGYDDFNDGFSYTFANGDFDGQTAVTTRAAARAARLGVVVVTAAGNEGSQPQNLLTPGDADTIITVGSVNFQNSVSGFSSSGPTNDGRIKPDIVAPGEGIVHAEVWDSTAYSMSNGTSMATPLAAGVAALVHSARPELTPVQVREALRETADNAASPQQRRGWGLVNAMDALLYHGMVFSTNPKVYYGGGKASIALYILSRNAIDANAARITYAAGSDGDATAALQFIEHLPGMGDNSGLYMFEFPDLPVGTEIRWYASASDSKENRSQPYGAPADRYTFRIGDSGSGSNPYIPGFTLDQSYPNPLTGESGFAGNIRYTIPSEGNVNLALYDARGRKVETLFEGVQARGVFYRPFYAAKYAAGLYYVQMDYNGERISRRMLVLK